jgi:hypothetical protein
VSAIDVLAEVLIGVVAAGDSRSPAVSEGTRAGVDAYLRTHPDLATPRVLATLGTPRRAPGAHLPAPPALPGPMDP